MTKETEVIIEVAWPFIFIGVAVLGAKLGIEQEKRKKLKFHNAKTETSRLKRILETAPTMQKILAFMAIKRVSRDSKQESSSRSDTFSHVPTKTSKIGEIGRGSTVIV